MLFNLFIIYDKIPNQSSSKNVNLPTNSEMRPITVYPNEAPKVIIKTQIPIREADPKAPLCSLEKKK